MATRLWGVSLHETSIDRLGGSGRALGLKRRIVVILLRHRSKLSSAADVLENAGCDRRRAARRLCSGPVFCSKYFFIQFVRRGSRTLACPCFRYHSLLGFDDLRTLPFSPTSSFVPDSLPSSRPLVRHSIRRFDWRHISGCGHDWTAVRAIEGSLQSFFCVPVGAPHCSASDDKYSHTIASSQRVSGNGVIPNSGGRGLYARAQDQPQTSAWPKLASSSRTAATFGANARTRVGI